MAKWTTNNVAGGHAEVICRSVQMIALNSEDSQKVLNAARRVADAVLHAIPARSCGLIYDGGFTIKVIPMDSTTEGERFRTSVAYGKDGFNPYESERELFLNGPKIASFTLREMKALIVAQSGLTEPYCYHFESRSFATGLLDCGTVLDLTASLIGGSRANNVDRVWEDDSYVAFFLHYCRHPGTTVVLPRKELRGDIFSLEDAEYRDLLKASYMVARHLEKALSEVQCGMIFESFTKSFGYVKLVPFVKALKKTEDDEAKLHKEKWLPLTKVETGYPEEEELVRCLKEHLEKVLVGESSNAGT
ncbi:MAG: hypothetical protein MMC33_000634 [Icmadophila ericetorum]|nr:hypothetical protein [Icmadophila ericetorum]